MAAMPEQNFSNHAKFTPIYHFALAPLTIVVLIWCVKRLISVPSADNALALLAAIVLLLLTAVVRTFPLKVQDRVIRLEEQLRLHRVLPAELHARIPEFTANQLVAMRFAADQELPDLAKRVLNDRITERKPIKQQIKNWRADHFRV